MKQLDRALEVKERDIKAYFMKQAKAHGCLVRKVRWENRNCALDWLLLYPVEFRCQPRFVELKRPGKEPTATQAIEHKKLIRYGAWVSVVASFTEVDDLFAPRFNPDNL